MTDIDRTGSPGTELVVRIPLAQDRHAPAQARAAIRETLDRWRVGALIDAVVLAASELVTNALRYGRPPVELTLRRRERSVRLDVHDDEPVEPDLHPDARAGDDAESGRGIAIVQAVADDVGCEHVVDDGKIVYATFDVNRQE